MMPAGGSEDSDVSPYHNVVDNDDPRLLTAVARRLWEK